MESLAGSLAKNRGNSQSGKGFNIKTQGSIDKKDLSDIYKPSLY